MSGWGREDESSSSISTSSSSHSRRPEPEIDVFAVRNRIVDKIMAKKQREESERAKETSVSRRKSRVPLADVSQGQDEMELTQVASTSSNGRNLNWTLDSARRQNRVYSSTPVPTRPDPQRESRASSEFVAPRPRSPTKSRPPTTSVIPEDDSEEEPPPSPPAPAPKVPVEEKKTRGRPRKDQSGPRKKPPARPRPKSPSPEPEPLAFASSDDDVLPARPELSEDEEEEEQPGPSTRQTSRVSLPKSPARSTADLSRTAPPKSPAKPTKATPAKPTKATPAKPTKATPAKPARAAPSKATSAKPARHAPADSPDDPGPSTSRAGGPSEAGPRRASSRRKAPPRRASPTTKQSKLFKELRKLQSEPGFLIPRLPFMRVVREIASNVSRENENFRFTVDAMEALQTATEYYLTSVFTDAAALANHAHRVTVMPRDLDLLRKLRVVDL